ncbi:hypothetical protein SAMN05216476_2890 [Pseudomonas mediterranea]|uniref:Uncharacterized protein n=1 Tax=Pseudomonas mediterranea TaxID=183795 RepID=A0AAX2DCC4_9PSED|nr:hypothetical protein SAMN05216476_2890 [Pseudomonas mediterranea]
MNTTFAAIWESCGSEPARDGAGSMESMLADPPLSRAGSLPQGIGGGCKHVGRARNSVAASLLAMAPGQWSRCWLIHRYREQARSHRGLAVDASMSAVPGTVCGSEPARDGAGSMESMLADPPLSRAGSLPQGIGGGCKHVGRARNSVAASLLAMAPGQWSRCWLIHRYREQARSHRGLAVDASMSAVPGTVCGSELARDGAGSMESMLADPPLSRAGSLPQGIGGGCKHVGRARYSVWERACSRWRRVSGVDVG